MDFVNFVDSDPCATKTCKFHGVCSEEAGVAKCSCFRRCSKSFHPVCGSDEVTYPNECTLKIVSCQQRALISIRNKGICSKFPTFSCFHFCSMRIQQNQLLINSQLMLNCLKCPTGWPVETRIGNSQPRICKYKEYQKKAQRCFHTLI